MSPRLGQCRPKEVERALLRGGFRFSHQRGNHRYFIRDTDKRVTSVPAHPGDIHRPLLKNIIKQAGFTENEFTAFLRGKKS